MSNPFENESIGNQLKIEKIKQARLLFPKYFHHNEKAITMLAFNKAETLLATCSADCSVNIYNALNFKMLNQYKFTVALKFLFFSLTDHLIAGSMYSDFFVFNAFLTQSKETFETLENPDHGLLSMDISPSNKYLGIIWQSRIDTSSLPMLAVYKYPRFEELAKKVILSQQIAYEITLPGLSRFKFHLLDHVVFAVVGQTLNRFDLTKSTEKPEKSLDLGPEVQVRVITASQRFEFLMVCYHEGVKVVDPDELTIFRNIETKHPVNCAQISNLMYAKQPKFHIILGGGIEAVLQASKSEGGNQIMLFDLCTEERLGEIRGSYGNINWILLFKDGSGVITAGEEGISRIYRFDISYYQNSD